MNKLITDLKCIDNIEKYDVAGLIVNHNLFSTFPNECFSFEEIAIIVNKCKKLNKKVFLNVDKIIEEDEVKGLVDELDRLITLDIDYYLFSDMALLDYFINHSLISKAIYNPLTIVASKYDNDYYKSIGVKTFVANEITLSEIENAISNNNSLLEIYGYHQMCYSKRKLLTLYNEFLEKDLKLNNKKFYIKEELRSQKYPIYESNKGTFIYTDYIYRIFEELDILQKALYYKISGIFIDEGNIFKIIEIYNKLLAGTEDKKELYDELYNIDNNIKEGFLYNKTILLKGDNDEES